MTYGLEVTTAPTALPVNAEEVAEYLRADPSETVNIQQLINLAVEEVERYTGRSLLETEYRYVLSDWPRGLPVFAYFPRNAKGPYERTLELPRSPLVSVESVKYYPEGSEVLTTLSASNYIVVSAFTPGRIYLKKEQEWPALSERPDAVQVEFTAGHQIIPNTMKQAILLLCRFYYAGGSPNDVDQGGNDLEKAHLLLNNIRVSGWCA